MSLCLVIKIRDLRQPLDTTNAKTGLVQAKLNTLYKKKTCNKIREIPDNRFTLRAIGFIYLFIGKFLYLP